MQDLMKDKGTRKNNFNKIEKYKVNSGDKAQQLWFSAIEIFIFIYLMNNSNRY